MDLKALCRAYGRAVRGEEPADPFINGLLSPLEAASAVYGTANAFRLWCYKAGLLKVRRLPCPVISVGNLTWGGTGKTPAVIMIAGLLKKRGIPVAVVSRGYKGAPSARVNVVSDGNRVLLDARAAGDEPLLLAKRLSGVPVLTCRRRHLGGRYACSKFQVAAVLLDDGFQHIQLARDVNILLLDATNPWGNGRLIPRGMLREPIPQMERADAVILTKCDQSGTETSVSRGGYFSRSKPTFRSRYVASALVNLYTDARTDPQTLESRRVYGFCGIADPRSFESTIRTLGASLVGFRPYGDHHSYTAEDLELLEEDAIMKGTELMVTTGKDGVKLRQFLPGKLPFLQLDIELELLEGHEEFLDLVIAPFSAGGATPALQG